MSGLKILIVGAGIAGPVAAYWLAEAGAEVEIVERAPSLRTGGQNVDIRGPGLTVLRRMEMEEIVHNNTTAEIGMRFVDKNNFTKAEFPATGDRSMTAEVEIMRGTLASILHKETEDRVKYSFGTTITSLHDDGSAVRAEFSTGKSRSYNLVIAADGQYSYTRDLAFGDTPKKAYKTLDQFLAWFKVPQVDSDDKWARWYNAPGRRLIMLRPDTKGKNEYLRAVIGVCGGEHYVNLRPAIHQSAEAQKALWRGIWADDTWQDGRVLIAMEKSEDFHMQEVLQVHLPSWSTGRVVLTGDAAYAPSPISGMGTTLAITGAYVLAGEIAAQPEDLSAAFTAYEEKMRPSVKKAQKLVPGAPWIANPETAWGIKFFYGLLAGLQNSGIFGLMEKLSFAGPPVDGTDLPDYSKHKVNTRKVSV